MKDGPLHSLIKMLSSLPGLGNRSARRIALYLLSRREFYGAAGGDDFAGGP